MSFFELITASWEDARVAIVVDGVTVTFGELSDRIARARGWLAAQGLTAGDVLALKLDKRLDSLCVHLAALSVGIPTLLINPRAPSAEARAQVDDAGAACFVQGPIAALRDSSPLPAGAPVDDDAIALLCYTSGTTGRPKGVPLSHGNLAACVRALHSAWRWSADDVLVHALPMTHIHGLVVAQHCALHAGACTVWLDRFEPREVLAAITAHRATIFMGVPTFYKRLVELGPSVESDLSSMRLFTSGSAALPAQTHARFADRFGHVILERYGMTEVGIVLANPYDGERRPGTVGLPLDGVEARIVDRELQIRGPSVFVGYRDRPEQTAAALVDGWMRTGDLATQDDDGYLRIVGRKKDLVISGGFNVVPGEVEAALLTHPALSEAAVVGAFDPDLGERVVASVVLSPSAEPPTSSEILAWVRGRLTPYKRPKVLAIEEALPRNSMGKLQKHLLREMWAEQRVRAARPEEMRRIAAWNIQMARETEALELDPAVALDGVQAVFQEHINAFYLVAECAGQPSGQCMVTTEWSDWRAREVWWIQSVYVPPEWRRRGVYRTLHEAVVQRAKQARAAGVRLYVDMRNSRAADVYRRVGMKGEHYQVFEQMFDMLPEAEEG